MKRIIKTLRTALCACFAVALFVPAAPGATTADGYALPETATSLTDVGLAGHTIEAIGPSDMFDAEPKAPQYAFQKDGKSRLIVKNEKQPFSLLYTFPEATKVNGYGLKTGKGASSSYSYYWEDPRAPKTWKIYGSNDYVAGDPSVNDANATWVLLDSRSDETWKSNGEYHYYGFENNVAYKTYKMTITGNAGAADYTQWNYMEYVRNATCRLTIDSVPVSIAAVTPARGMMAMPDESTTFTSEASVATESMKAVCIGYKVYVADETAGWVEDAARSGTTSSFTWETMPTVDTKVEWQYDAECRLALERTPTGGGTATAEKEWFAYGTTATVTAAPEAGHSFFCWSGDVPIENEKQNPLTLTMDMPRTVQPVFMADDATGPTLFVSTTGNDANTGYTPSAALLTVSAAIAKLKETSGGVIRVAKGEYVITKQIALTNAITVLGDAEDRPVFKVKDGVRQRVFEINHPQARIENLVLKNGSFSEAWKTGFVLRIGNNGGTAANCLITDAEALKPHDPAAVSLEGVDARLLNCEISDITGNSSLEVTWKTAIIGLNLAAGVAENCLIRNVRAAGLTLANKNSRVVIVGKDGRLLNCTIVGCAGNNSVCEAALADDGGATVINCAFFGNESGQEDAKPETKAWSGNGAAYQNCAADMNEAVNDTCLPNLSATDFVDFTNGDYTPKYGGLLFNGGHDVSTVFTTDLAGNPRVDGSKIDIGAFEGSSKVTLLVCGIPEAYGTASPAWGTHEGLSGQELTATAQEETVSGDGLLKTVCVGWTLYVIENETRRIVGSGDGATATIQVPTVHAELEWRFERYHRVSLKMVGEGEATVPEWVREGETFHASATASAKWRFLGWTDADGRIVEDPGTDPVRQAVAFRAVFLSENLDRIVQHVSMEGDDENDGLTSETAKKTMAAALAVVSDYGDFGGVLHVARGEYGIANQLVLPHPIHVIGDAISRPIVKRNTASSYRVFRLNHAQAKLENLVLKNGSYYQEGQNGFLLNIDAQGGTAINCVFTAAEHRQPHNSAAVYMTSPSARLLNCEISDISGNAALECGWASPVMGLYINAGIAENCLIRNVRAAGLGDSAKDSRVVKVASAGRLVNSTIVACAGNNSVCEASPAADGGATVINCAFFGNESGQEDAKPETKAWSGSAASYQNCASDTASDAEGAETTLLPATCLAGLAAADFKDCANGDFKPAVGGLLYNKGAEVTLFAATDLAGKPRVQGSKIDIGAYEAPAGGFRILVR